jgi:hypothetical protein
MEGWILRSQIPHQSQFCDILKVPLRQDLPQFV